MDPIGPLGTNFNEILFKIYTFSVKKNAFQNVVCKMAAILSQPQCVNELQRLYYTINTMTADDKETNHYLDQILTHWGLVAPHGNMDLNQHWLR